MNAQTTPGASILVVDHDDPVRQSTADILRNEDFDVVEADLGETMMARLRERMYGLVLVDPDLPFTNGVDVLEQVADPPPVIVVSARPVEEQDRRRLHSVVTYLEKPVPPPMLIAAVRAVLR